MKKKMIVIALVCAAVIIAVLCVILPQSEQPPVVQPGFVPTVTSTSADDVKPTDVATLVSEVSATADVQATEVPAATDVNVPETTAVPQVTATAAASTPVKTPEATEEPFWGVDIAHDIVVKMPLEYEGTLLHKQETQGDKISEIFSMLIGKNETMLYRVDFGDADAGEWLGTLRSDAKNIAVTYKVFIIEDKELEKLDNEVVEEYYALMESVNEVLSAVSGDPRFTFEKHQDEADKQENELMYWDVDLPAGITFAESNDDNGYQAVFSCEIRGESVELYAVRIGNAAEGSVLGMYKLNDASKPVSVVSYDLGEHLNWSKSDYDTAYGMMESINVVIEAITESENFSFK